MREVTSYLASLPAELQAAGLLLLEVFVLFHFFLLLPLLDEELIKILHHGATSILTVGLGTA